MNVNLEPGKYVVAVSGGVDSVSLFHVLSGRKDLELIVAHFDHGIRPASAEDYEFVKKLAFEAGCQFAAGRASLGPHASEAQAREKRYYFLHKVREQKQARAVVTAHHQDDVLETAAINLMRGTYRKGLTSLDSRAILIRPMLGFSKAQIKKYAQDNNLQWREDTTNQEDRYLRNRIRRRLEGQDGELIKELVKITEKLRGLNRETDEAVNELLDIYLRDDLIRRRDFTAFPHGVSKEFLAGWLRRKNLKFDSKSLDRLAVGMKTKTNGARLEIDKTHYYKIGLEQISLETR